MADVTFGPHVCEESPNPRIVGFCACGKPIPRKAQVRDVEYEREFLKQVEDACLKRYGVNVVGFALHVSQRLTLGAERYGDDDFLSKDVMDEFNEEAADMCAYALLEAQKLLSSGVEDDGRAVHLFEASVLAAAASYHARMARGHGT